MQTSHIPGEEISAAFSLRTAVTHNKARIRGSGPISICTDTPQWSYAAALRLDTKACPLQDSRAPLLIQIETTVESGCIGFLFVADDLQTVLSTTAEQSGGDGPAVSEILVDPAPDSGWLVVRNLAREDKPSKCHIRAVRAFQTPLGRTPLVSTEILKSFRPWAGTVPAGFFASFLGNLTRASYWAFSPEIGKLYDHERFESVSSPSVDDNIFDWLILLEAAAEAKHEFVMAALGGGWGRWLVAGALAVRQFSGIPCRLIGVEAEPTHFQWMLEHFRDNHLDPAEHDLIEAAASGKSGHVWFYFGKPDTWYGQSIISGKSANATSFLQEISYNGERAKLVRTVDIVELTKHYERIDYLHMDIQGAELEFLAKKPSLLDRKVKRLLVGTHSTEIEAGLRDLFHRLKWHCQYDVPLNGKVRVNDSELTIGDGVQVWINPRL